MAWGRSPLNWFEWRKRPRSRSGRAARLMPSSHWTGGGATIFLADREAITADVILANCAPATLQRLLGNPYQPPVGSQTKINIVVRRLPRFRSGLEPAIGFAGTLHLGQGYRSLQQAYEDASAGQMPDPMPCEVYCHTLTDGSILDPELRAAGYHTLTLFGMHTPANLFMTDPAGSRERAKEAALRSLRSVLAEPLEPCLALDRHGEPCIEVMTPLDIEAELRMPGGHIFHGDLAWPWLADDASAATRGGALGRRYRLPRDPVVRLRSGTRWRRQWSRRPQRC